MIRRGIRKRFIVMAPTAIFFEEVLIEIMGCLDGFVNEPNFNANVSSVCCQATLISTEGSGGVWDRRQLRDDPLLDHQVRPTITRRLKRRRPVPSRR